MATEQSLYAQVIMFRRKDLKFDAADKNKNASKFKFQDQYARSRYWFDLDLDWIDINFSTCVYHGTFAVMSLKMSYSPFCLYLSRE